MEKPKDDLDAVRIIVQTLESFDKEERERIVRWATEKLGMQLAGITAPRQRYPQELIDRPVGTTTDLKTFIADKAPKHAMYFAATVAYYHKFVAQSDNRKESINKEDLSDAVRKVAWRPGLTNPGQTLINAYSAGLLDKTPERGEYKLNTVGESLVAVILPDGEASTSKTVRRTKKPATGKKKAQAKKRPRGKKRSRNRRNKD